MLIVTFCCCLFLMSLTYSYLKWENYIFIKDRFYFLSQNTLLDLSITVYVDVPSVISIFKYQYHFDSCHCCLVNSSSSKTLKLILPSGFLKWFYWHHVKGIRDVVFLRCHQKKANLPFSVITDLTRTLEWERWHSKLLDSCWGLESFLLSLKLLFLNWCSWNQK